MAIRARSGIRPRIGTMVADLGSFSATGSGAAHNPQFSGAVLADLPTFQAIAAGTYTAPGGDTGLGFTPAKILTFQGMAVGANGSGANGMVAPVRGAVSDAVQGPFNSNRVYRVDLVTSSQFFGGAIYHHNAALLEGSDVWVRLPMYFPASWYFRHGNQSEDGWGAIKWLRLQWGANDWQGPRHTLQLDGFSTSNEETCILLGSSLESGPGGESWIYFDEGPNNVIVKNQWQFAQWHVRVSSNASVGYIEAWIGDKYVGRKYGYTKPSSTSNLYNIQLGDYYNGGVVQPQHFFMDNAVIALSTPADLDSGGRAYIAPTRNAEAA